MLKRKSNHVSIVLCHRGLRAEFLEKEAELSGSDFNSADEAEGSDDDMEEEEGDREHFDSNELRDQVRNRLAALLFCLARFMVTKSMVTAHLTAP